MADRSKARIVDGYSALKAAQRHVEQGKPKPADATGPPKNNEANASAQPKPIGTHIGRTVMPTKWEIVCYACQYEFKMTGKAKNTFCPKCRKNLDLSDHKIDGPHDADLVTAGKIHLTSGAVLNGGTLTANEIVVEGTVKGGQLIAHKWLELAPGSVCPQKVIQARNLRIAPEASITFRKEAEVQDVEVLGEFQAHIVASGVVTVRPGGFLKGRVQGARLVVEEGGGLAADVHIVPEAEKPGGKGKKP